MPHPRRCECLERRPTRFHSGLCTSSVIPKRTGRRANFRIAASGSVQLPHPSASGQLASEPLLLVLYFGEGQFRYDTFRWIKREAFLQPLLRLVLPSEFLKRKRNCSRPGQNQVSEVAR